MKFVNSSNHKSFSDAILNKNDVNPDLTSKQVRAKLENEAVAFEQKEKEKKEFLKFASKPLSNETHPGFKTEMTDEHIIVEDAAKELIAFISDLDNPSHSKKHRNSKKHKAGIDISKEEFRSVKSHNDLSDNSVVTDKAHVAFNVNFELPGLNKFKTAKFIVSYDLNSDVQYKVEDIFYGEDLQEYPLNSETLNNYMNTETDMKTAKADKMVVWFNAETGAYEDYPIVASCKDVTARLASLGFSVDQSYWMDSCHNPHKFGKVVAFVDVPLNRVDEFKKTASMKDDEWVNRGSENGKADKSKDMSGDAWVNRTEEKKGYEHKDFKKGDQWVNRTDEKGPEIAYPNEKTMMLSANKKEDEKPVSTMDKIAALEKLLED